jgi:endonuclease/exonuclease/phosphatase family metal-dependent hydrolase
VILLQEATCFDLHGDELLLFVERQLGVAGYGRYRGFLTPSQRSAHHQLILLNTERLQAIHHWRGADADESPCLRGFVEAIVDGDESKTVWLRSIHLDPRDGAYRLAEAKQIHDAVPAAQHALIAGDFTEDAGALDHLLGSGWICQHTADGNPPEPAVDRCLTTGGLIPVARSAWLSTAPLPHSHHHAMGGAIVIGGWDAPDAS